MTLRKGGYLQGKTDAINELREALGANVRDSQQQIYVLCVELNKPKVARPDGTAMNAEEALASLEDQVVRLQHTLTRFRPTDGPTEPRFKLGVGDDHPVFAPAIRPVISCSVV